MCGFSNLTRHVSVSRAAAAAADGFLNHLKLDPWDSKDT